LAGSCYLSVPLGPNGAPVDWFLIDPPQLVDMAAMGLSAIGTKIVPWTYTDLKTLEEVSTHYVLDVVGMNNYPNVADFIEETRRYGVSRRISRNSDFSLLDTNSRLILIHERAWIENADQYITAREEGRGWCPRDIPSHLKQNPFAMCASLYWEDIEKGEKPKEEDEDAVLTHGRKMRNDQPGVQMHLQRTSDRAVIREMATFRYRGLRRPDDVTPRYRLAAFATFPIPLIQVVRDPIGQSHVAAVESARKSGIEVREVNE
jgi:hypothetical protein